jgi:AcrR family transcriptional regulator
VTKRSSAGGRQRRPDARPTEILSAALDLFAEKGFTATRMEDVAARAGLSKAAIYLYFDDKTAVLEAVVRHTVLGRLDEARAMAEGHQGRVADLLRLLLMFMAGRMVGSRLPDIIKLIVAESRAHPEIGRFYLDNVIMQGLPLFEGLIRRGIAGGEFRPVDAALAVKSLIAPMLMAAIWRTVFEPLGATPLDIEALASQHADLVIRGLEP